MHENFFRSALTTHQFENFESFGPGYLFSARQLVCSQYNWRILRGPNSFLSGFVRERRVGRVEARTIVI